jgi:hypothetical protein
MSALIIAFILIGSLMVISFILISIHNKHKRKDMNELLKYFSQAGIENKLSFSSQEVLSNCVLGLDGIHRKILVVTKGESGFKSLVIDMNEVKNCSVKKVFGTIRADDLKDNKLEQYLEKITLQFDIEGKPSVEIAFYRNSENHVYEMLELEQKAGHWESILSKMKPALKNTAIKA